MTYRKEQTQLTP